MSSYSGKCAECGGEMAVSVDPVPFELRDATIAVPGIEHGRCLACGEVVLDLPSAGRLQREAIRQYKQEKGLLTPDEIRTLRHSLGLSQAAFERLLGTGPKTVVRWEKGTVLQSATADRLMRVIRAMPEAVEVLRTMGAQLSPTGRSRILRS